MDRCWTSDRLARRGLPHQDACPFCDQHDETISHLLVECVLAREVWTRVFSALGIPGGAPQAGEALQAWCTRQSAHGHHAKTVRTICLLTLWEMWKHRNAIVFDGATVCLARLMDRITNESTVWKQAGILRGELAAAFIAAPEWTQGE